ncbi:hypothetical protein BC827DRAFT_1157644 [Russula dissimulans]|nr:hypothetical protein BC827DRAFT_1157644 [Russula dissimulans]
MVATCWYLRCSASARVHDGIPGPRYRNGPTNRDRTNPRNSASPITYQDGHRRDEYSNAEPDEEVIFLAKGERDPQFLHRDAVRPATGVSTLLFEPYQGLPVSDRRRGEVPRTNHALCPYDHQLLKQPVEDKLQNRCPPNVVRNQMYNAFTFLPIMFYEQFNFFFNLYFFSSRYLIHHCTQNRFPRDLHSAFVLHLTMGKASDDNYRPILTAKPTLRATLRRRRRFVTRPSRRQPPSHGAVPSSRYAWRPGPTREEPACACNMVGTERRGPGNAELPSDQELLNLDAEIHLDAPTKDIDSSMKVKS